MIATGSGTGQRDGLGAMVIALCVATPLVMLFARSIPPAMLTFVSLLLGLRIARGARDWSVAAMFGQSAQRRVVGITLLFIVLAVLSLLVSGTAPGGGSGRTLLTFSGSVLLLLLAARLEPPRRSPAFCFVALATIVLVAVFIVIETRAGGGIKRSFGLAGDLFRMNRAAVMIGLMLPLVLLTTRSNLRLLFVTLAIAAAILGIFSSQSETAKLTLLVVLAVMGFAALAPSAAFLAVGGLAVAATLLMPIIAPNILLVIPPMVQDYVGYASLTIRGEIWREFGALFWLKPVLGFGFDASSSIASTSIGAALPYERRALLAWGHPHNIPLQVWFEFGLVGGLVLTALVAAAFRALWDLPDRERSAAITIFAGVYVTSAVSHGAWQEWWWCLIGLIIVMFRAATASPQRPV